MKTLLLFSLCALSCAELFSATVYRVDTIPEGDWSNPAIWNSSSVPADGDSVFLDKSGVVTNVTSDAAIRQIEITSGALCVSSGTLGVSYRLLNYGGTLDISGGSVKTSDAFNMGDSGRSDVSSDALLNVYGSANVTDSHWGILIGELSKNYNSTANFYGDSTYSATKLKIGSTNDDAVGVSTLNVYDRAKVEIGSGTGLAFEKNGVFNIYGSASVSVASKAFIGDNSGLSAAKMTVSDNASLQLKSYTLVHDGAVLTAKGNAVMTFGDNFILGTADDNDASATTSGHLILKDSATMVMNNRTLVMYGDDSTIELHGSNIKPADGLDSFTHCLGNTSKSSTIGTGGTIKFVADSEGISTFVARYIEYNDEAAQTAYAIELDFTNFNPLDGAGEYSFAIISSINNWNGREAIIMQNYLNGANEGDGLVSITKANEADSYEFFLSDGGRTFNIAYTYVPEPAAYAAAFGALALAFAAYRRRS